MPETGTVGKFTVSLFIYWSCQISVTVVGVKHETTGGVQMVNICGVSVVESSWF